MKKLEHNNNSNEIQNDFKSLNPPKLFGYRPTTPVLKTIAVGRIQEPIIQDRFNFDIEENEAENIEHIPLEVVLSRESSNYILIRGRRLFLAGKKQNITHFCCLVIGEVDSDQEAGFARINHVLTPVKSFHVLEQARAIHNMVKLIDGYNHGGARRGKNYQKQKAIDVLRDVFPHKRSMIDDLKRFGENVGPLGIKGLYHLLIATKKELPISLIHQANAILKDRRTEIDQIAKDKETEGKDEAEIGEEVAKYVYDIIFEPRHSPEKQLSRNKDIGDESDEGEEEQEGKKPVKNKKPGHNKYEGVTSEDFSPIREAFDGFAEKVKDFESFFNGKKELDASETETLHKMGKEIENLWSEFWMLFIKVDI